MGDFLRGEHFPTYKDEIVKTMNMLAENDKVVFVGQLVNYWGCIYGTLEDVPMEKKIEVPIFEDTQMGIAIGLALEGFIPVTVYSRMDFLVLAMNQLVNHLDKIRDLSCERFKPKVIIRTAVGSTQPLYPGLQHCSDYTDGLRHFLKNVEVVELNHGVDIFPAYKHALERKDGKSTLLVEKRDLYSMAVK